MSGKQKDHITYVPKVGFSGITDGDRDKWKKEWPEKDIDASLEYAKFEALNKTSRLQQILIARDPRDFIDDYIRRLSFEEDGPWLSPKSYNEEFSPETLEEFIELIDYKLKFWRAYAMGGQEAPSISQSDFLRLKDLSIDFLKETNHRKFPSWSGDPEVSFADLRDWWEQFRQVKQDRTATNPPLKVEGL